MKVIAVLTTKDRPDYFKRALQSVREQTALPDEVYVVTDSSEKNRKLEMGIISQSGVSCRLLKDEYTHNYAGSLNTAVHAILKGSLSGVQEWKKTYIAFLDDDDRWLPDYIRTCRDAASGRDFVVTGLVYCDETGKRKLSVPKELGLQDFLKRNPHIQGSNTFVKLSALLAAGLFDENMSSTTDRDLFSRLMLTGATYAVKECHLVEIDAYNDRERITNGREKKADGLGKFYRKYARFMTGETENEFFRRAEGLFKVGKTEILKGKPSGIPVRPVLSDTTYRGRLVIGCIVTDYEAGLRLMRELADMARPETKIVVLYNCGDVTGEFRSFLTGSGYDSRIYTLNDIRGMLHEDIDLFITEEDIGGEKIRDIAVARTALQKILYAESAEGDVIWILDEDMELKGLYQDGNGTTEYDTEIDRVIPLYRGTYDAVIGRYTLDAPLPLLSTVRTTLVDYYYHTFGHTSEESAPCDRTDEYYDLSDANTSHLETPEPVPDGTTLDDVFSGKAVSRKLAVRDTEIRDAYSRGGNTLIFKRELLTIPNWSLRIGETIGRRSDYFWVLLAKQYGYKIADAPFATLHNRKPAVFDYHKETDKLLADFIGASFTRAYGKAGKDNKDSFLEEYGGFFEKRLTKYVASYCRVQGILRMLGDTNYGRFFTDENLTDFIGRCKVCTDRESVAKAYENLTENLGKLENFSTMRDRISGYFGVNGLKTLGYGGESVVFTDHRYVYKCFRKPEDLEFLKEKAPVFGECRNLNPLEFFRIGETDVIRYPYASFKSYDGGYAEDLAALLSFGKENGIVFENIKKTNFIVCGDTLKFIDYGEKILPYTEEAFLRTVRRAYEMFRYPFLPPDDFKEIIGRCYRGETGYIDDGWNRLFAMTGYRYKEDLHDITVANLVRNYKPHAVLDYGAGKCRLINSLAGTCETFIYDIDRKTILKRADPRVKIIRDIDAVPDESCDLILCNLVLCCIDDGAAKKVTENVARLLKTSGHAIISICHPFFNRVRRTELRTSGLKGPYGVACRYEKNMRIGTPVRTEFHRPAEYYENLFARYGLEITGAYEGEGVDTESLLPAPEHLIFDCEKNSGSEYLADCSLLVKTNPMEHRSVYRNLRHITGELERGVRFARRIVAADLTSCKTRARMYDADDEEGLCRELERAKANGLIDEILYIRDNPDHMQRLYERYFGCVSGFSHAENGQGLYATLAGFEQIRTPYVLQTDSDILYHVNAEEIRKNLLLLKKEGVTSTFGIVTDEDEECTFGHRTEVRTCFLNLPLLRNLLPLPNKVEDGKYTLGWHRALDLKLRKEQSFRFHSRECWFVHPENDKKKNADFLAVCTDAVGRGIVPSVQKGEVNLRGEMKDWARTSDAATVVYIRGYNTPCEKLKRMFDSLRGQTFRDFGVVYIDDASETDSREYARFILTYDPFFRSRSVFVGNTENRGELYNLIFAMNFLIKNPETVVVSLDNDDWLVNTKALEIIVNRFAEGAEYTCGNCIRYDKPTKKYTVQSFERVWEREGDNIWLHPKCFRRRLFDCIDVDRDLKIDGVFPDVCTDYAFVLPMIENSKKNVFIEEVLYYFEPSPENRNGEGKYRKERKKEIRDILLRKAEKRFLEHNNTPRNITKKGE